MADTIKPSVDWLRRTSPLNGNEDLLRQNPVGDASSSPKEERIPVDLIKDYVLNALPDDVYVVSGIVNGTDLELTMSDASEVVIDLSPIVGGSSGILRYSAGNGCFVVATGSGVTYTKSTGVGNLTVPSGVNLISFRIVGASGDLNSGELQINIIGGAGSGSTYNTNNANAFYPSFTIVNRNVLGPTDPFLQRPDDAGDSIDIFHNQLTVSGRTTSSISGLSGDFEIQGNL